jgi:hypothetical protein
MVAVEAFSEPDMPACIVVQKENANRAAIRISIIESELAQDSSQNTHQFYEPGLI